MLIYYLFLFLLLKRRQAKFILKRRHLYRVLYLLSAPNLNGCSLEQSILSVAYLFLLFFYYHFMSISSLILQGFSCITLLMLEEKKNLLSILTTTDNHWDKVVTLTVNLSSLGFRLFLTNHQPILATKKRKPGCIAINRTAMKSTVIEM